MSRDCRSRRTRKHRNLSPSLDGGPGKSHGDLGQAEDVQLIRDPLSRLDNYPVVGRHISGVPDPKGAPGQGLHDLDGAPLGSRGCPQLHLCPRTRRGIVVRMPIRLPASTATVIVASSGFRSGTRTSCFAMSSAA